MPQAADTAYRRLAGTRQIYLSRLLLSGFRNHLDTRLELGPGLTVFEGANGQGKSNLLEAAYLLAIAKSPRATNDRELVNWNVGRAGGHVQVLGVGREGDVTVQAQVDMDVATAVGDQERGISLRRSLRVNGIVRTAYEFVGNLNVVFFDARDLEIVTGSPSVRRRYLDILIGQSDSSYLKTLGRYNRVVAQRNQLLRNVRDGRSNPDELEFWDERLAYEGASVVESRRRAVAGLVEHAVPAHAELTGGDRLSLIYEPRLSPSPIAGERIDELHHGEIVGRLVEGLAAARQREVAQGATVVGPHRDDVTICLDGESAGTYASRGQARIIALSLKIAEAAFVRQTTGHTPVLALDDILSELDPVRRRKVMEAACRYEQVLLTTTEVDMVAREFLADASLYKVHDGAVSPDAA